MQREPDRQIEDDADHGGGDRGQGAGELAVAAQLFDEGRAGKDPQHRRYESHPGGQRGAKQAGDERRKRRRFAERGEEADELRHQNQWPRRGLGEAERVHHFRRRQPTVRLDHLLRHIGQHGISAAEGHHRELGEKYPDVDKNMVRPQGQRDQCNGRPPDCETNDCGDCELPPTTAGIIGDIRRFDGEAEQIRTRPGDKITGQRCGNNDQRKRHGKKENADERQRRERNQKRRLQGALSDTNQRLEYDHQHGGLDAEQRAVDGT